MEDELVALAKRISALEDVARRVIATHEYHREQGYCRLCGERWPCTTVAELETALDIL
jgi:hypothetical protein